jgi:hypothetical protein
MPSNRQILVGREVYAYDGMNVGEVQGVTGDAEFVIIGRGLSGDLLVPMDELHEIEDRLQIQRTKAYLDSAPEVDGDHLTLEDRQRLERFFRPRAA